MNDPAAKRNHVIESHHYLCERAARKFVRDGIDRQDLVQIAAIGLIKAADRYDADIGTPFEAYAWVYVLGELMHYVRDAERTIRVPRRVLDLKRRWLGEQSRLRCARGCEPTDNDVYETLNLGREDECELRLFQESEITMSVDAIPPSKALVLSYTIDSHLDHVTLVDALETLSSVEREVIKEIYENDRPLGEVAQRLGYSRRHASRLHKNALRKLAPFACHRAG